MASSMERSCGGAEEPELFRRSHSRVYFDSDCSSPTSWEFRGLGPSRSNSPPAPMRLSLLRLSAAEAAASATASAGGVGVGGGVGSCSKGEVHADGSRNSTGSSAGSHRSQDSGFSDSGESRGQRQQQQPHQLQLRQEQQHNFQPNKNSSHHHQLVEETYSSHHAADAAVHNGAGKKSVALIQRRSSQPPSPPPPPVTTPPPPLATNGSVIFNDSLSHHHHHHHHHQSFRPACPSQYFPSPSHKGSDMVNGSLAQYRQVYRQVVCCPHHVEDADCGNSIYQEVILAQPNGGSPVSSLPPAAAAADTSVVDLGAPACCSTPKQQGSKSSRSRVSIMEKIDNFESLNKNKKLLDSNNNNSGSSGSTSNGWKVSNGHSGAGTECILRNGHSSSSTLRTTAGALRRTSPRTSSGGSEIISGGDDNNGSVVCTGGGVIVIPNGISSASTQKSFNSGQLNEDLYGTIHDEPSVCASRVAVGCQSPTATSPAPTSPKWQSLPKGFQRVPISSPTKSEEVIVVRSQADNDALRRWLHDLRCEAEPECLNTLQTKALVRMSDEAPKGRCYWNRGHDSAALSPAASPLVTTTTATTTTLAIHSVSTPLLSIRNVEQMACVISGEFSKICKHLEFGFFAQVPSLVESLADNLDEFLKHFHETFGNLHKLEKRLAASCYELRVGAQSLRAMLMTSTAPPGASHRSGHHNHQNDRSNASSSPPGDSDNKNREQDREFHLVVGEIVEGIVALGNLFGQVVDQRLTRDLSSILDTIEGGGLPSRVGLKSFATILNDGGMHICRLAASIRTVRGLLGVLLDAKDDNDRMLALRCLATILCVGEAVKDFDKAGGFEIVADILYDSSYPIPIKFEAVSVLAQATDPWIDLETTLVNLGYHLEKIVVSLTNMISQCPSHEDGFLLTIAAISNLTFLEVSSLELLRRHRTVYLIINAIKAKPDFSIFVLDHVATVLANMAGSERCRKEIIRSGGIVTLLCFLQQRPSPFESAAEIAACERLQQKSTIAISRLCNEDGVAQMVVEMKGMQRMIQLCRQDKERNYSDGVLIACLATLRKLATFCGEGVIRALHADDLIQPRLLDSFLMYSSRQESYV